MAQSFEFTHYEIDAKKQEFSFFYKLNFFDKPSIEFLEKIIFNEPFNLESIPKNLLENLLSSIHIMLGISYYKLYCPRKIIVNKQLSEKQANFWNIIYRKGLGEFAYKNQLNIGELVNFPFIDGENDVSNFLKRKNRFLVGIGGGKDSIVSAELLKTHGKDIKAFLVETQKEDVISRNVIKKLDIEAIVIKRQIDEKIFNLLEGSYNGHIPISAIFAFLGYLTAVLYDYSNIIVSNEFSSNFGNINYNGEQVNHQWSKSMEFEALFQKFSLENFCPNIVYFSLLRQFYEIRIMEMFVKYKKYLHIFSSCNRNFRVHKDRPKTLWCGECPKCVFAWILLSAFLEKDELVSIFQKNLYKDENLLPLFNNILGYGKMKPFDCVGTFEESQAAFYMAIEKFKEGVYNSSESRTANSMSQEKFTGSIIFDRFKDKLQEMGKSKEKVFKINNAPTLPDDFKFYGLKNVLIIGYGKEGKVNEEYLKKYFPEIQVGIADKKDGEDYLSIQNNYDFAVKTPGICKENINIPYTTATNLFFSQLKNNLKIGITGSKGKSTTSSLIYAILKEAGKKVRLIGNIGNPMLEVLFQSIDEDEIFIIELSSYQLDDIRYSPEIAVITNLFAEHLDYHHGVENYHLAKKNIIKYQNKQDFFIFNGENESLQKWISDTIVKKEDFTNIDLSGIETSLLGEHNRKNIQSAVAVAHILKISDDYIKKAIKDFKPLNHRLEFVGEFKGIKFYDDAIATIPEATIEAIKALPQTETIFLGGLDRGYDFYDLINFINKTKIRNIVLFPDSGIKIENTLKELKFLEKYNILHTKDMKEAVQFAYAYTNPGKICLLSTASPSYSIWSDFIEKGKIFQEWVLKLGKKEKTA